MKDTDYAYAVSRIRANERKFLTSSDIESVIGAKDLTQAVSFLTSKGWAKESEKSDISDIIKAQNKEVWTLLCESVPDKSELSVFTVINDFYNIKAALKCSFLNTEPDGYFAYPTSIDTDALKQALKTHDFSLLGEDFEKPIKEAYEALARSQNGQNADIILDSAALSLFLKKGENSRCELLKEVCEFFVCCVNIKTAVRCARTNKSVSFAKTALAPCRSLDVSLMASLCENGEKELFSYLLTTKFEKGAEILKTDAASFEKWCDDSITEKIKEAKFSFFGFAPICAYYYAKQSEIKTVRIILSAKESGLSKETIEKRVRELYE